MDRLSRIIFALATCCAIAACAHTIDLDKPPTPEYERVALSTVEQPQKRQLQKWFAKSKKWVEAETGAELSEVKLRLLPRAQMAEIGEATLNQLFIDKPVYYRLLKELKERSGRDVSASVVALFDPVLNDILLPVEGLKPFSQTVVGSGATLQEAYTALFVHELVHAADYALYPNNLIFSQKNLGNLAVRAVVEGHAQYLTRKICSDQNCRRGYETLRDDVVSGVDSENIRVGGAASAGKTLSNFCYHHGEQFFNKLESHVGAIEQALSHPPTDPVMIRYPDVYLAGVRRQKQEKLSAVFHSTATPWNADRSLLLHNTNFVPFDGYNTQKQLAQNNYEILHESENGLETTNVNIFWKSDTAAARSFYKRLLKPRKTRRSSDGKYDIHLLQKSSEIATSTQSSKESVSSIDIEMGKMEFIYAAANSAEIDSLPSRVQQIYIGASGPYVVSVARFSSSLSDNELPDYTRKLLRALIE